MPFDLDCRDRSGLAPGAVDALRQLEQLNGVAAMLGPDELAVLLLVAQRLAKGRRQYGELHIGSDRRCFPVEALEEAADGLAYAAVALLRGAR